MKVLGSREARQCSGRLEAETPTNRNLDAARGLSHEYAQRVGTCDNVALAAGSEEPVAASGNHVLKRLLK